MSIGKTHVNLGDDLFCVILAHKFIQVYPGTIHTVVKPTRDNSFSMDA